MAEQTLLQQARETYDGTRPVLLGDVDARAFNVLRTAVGLLLQYLEKRESDARTLHTPGQPKPPCKVCGRLTGGCCTVMKQPGEVAYVDQVNADPSGGESATTPRCTVCGETADRLIHHGYYDDHHEFEPDNPPPISDDDARAVCRNLDVDIATWAAQVRERVAAADLDLDLDALQKLCDAATPGPWEANTAEWCVDGPHEELICNLADPASEQVQRDAAFIAAARDALPKLIAEVRRLRG